MTDVDHRALAESLAHESPAEALVHATLHLADVFAAAWPPMSELMGEGPVPDRYAEPERVDVDAVKDALAALQQRSGRRFA